MVAEPEGRGSPDDPETWTTLRDRRSQLPVATRDDDYDITAAMQSVRLSSKETPRFHLPVTARPATQQRWDTVRQSIGVRDGAGVGRAAMAFAGAFEQEDARKAAAAAVKARLGL